MMLKGGRAADGQYSLHAPLLHFHDSRACKLFPLTYTQAFRASMWAGINVAMTVSSEISAARHLAGGSQAGDAGALQAFQQGRIALAAAADTRWAHPCPALPVSRDEKLSVDLP